MIKGIEQCPLCGKEPKTWLGKDNKTQNIECCDVFVTGPVCVELWNKIAAAMSLAKTEVDLAITIKNTDDLPIEIHKGMMAVREAKLKVFEVFGERDGRERS